MNTMSGNHLLTSSVNIVICNLCQRMNLNCTNLKLQEIKTIQFSHLVNVMASKQLADYEIRRDGKDKKEQAEK